MKALICLTVTIYIEIIHQNSPGHSTICFEGKETVFIYIFEITIHLPFRISIKLLELAFSTCLTKIF